MLPTAINRGLRFGFALAGVLLAVFPSIALGQCTKITASDATENDQFGWSLAMAGDYLIVGAKFADSFAGSVYIFQRSDNGTPGDPNDDTWLEQVRLTPSDIVAPRQFGRSVDISGNYLIVGAPVDDHAGALSGSAYVFLREGANWIQLDKLVASDAAGGELFGNSVAIEGDYAIVGAPRRDEVASTSGTAYVFERDDNATPADLTDDTWIERTKLVYSDPAASDSFGESISMNGNRALIGAERKKHATGRGLAYVFRRDGANWIEEAVLTPSVLNSNSRLVDVSLTENAAALAYLASPPPPLKARSRSFAAKVQDSGPIYQGWVYVFRRVDTIWAEEQSLVPVGIDRGASFGDSVAMAGDTLLVGSTDDSGSDIITGTAFLFRFSGENWIQDAKLFAADGSIFDTFGQTIAIDGEHVAVAAKGDDGACPENIACNSGSAYTFWLPATPECMPIPTISMWGLAVLTLLFLTAGTCVLRRRVHWNIGRSARRRGCMWRSCHVANSNESGL